MIARRAVTAAISTLWLTTPVCARAQEARKRFRVGLLGASSRAEAAPFMKVFVQRLGELGYVEGRDIEFQGRNAKDSQEQLSIMAAEVVRLSPDAIIAGVNTTIAVFQRATSTIPIVMVASVDPVGHGFVKSLARPGGNITGLSYLASDETHGKLLQTLREIVPGLSAVGLIMERGYASSPWLETAGHRLGLRIEREEVRSVDQVEQAFAAIKRRRVDGITVLGGTPMWSRRHQIAELALASRTPAIAFERNHAEAGFLFTYGPHLSDLFRRSADYIDRILKGAKPADLPVEQPTKFDFVINLKTAKALGITIPHSLLLRADEVIQ